MRCYICDAPIAEPHYNRDHESYDPCVTCLTIIDEVFDDYIEHEDARPEDPEEDEPDAMEDLYGT